MSQAKTEAPTAQRMRTLREKGQVPLSRRLSSAVAALAGLAATAFLLPGITRDLAALLELGLRAGVAPVEGALLGGRLLVAYGFAITGAAALGAILAGGIQTGWLFAPSRLAPSVAAFNPVTTWSGRLKANAWWGGALGLAQSCVALVAGWTGIQALVRAAERSAIEIAAAALADASATSVALEPVSGPLAMVGAWWLGASALVALADVSVQRQLFEREHRMSLQEIRDEYKQSEGDPQHKARRERAHRDLLRESVRDGARRSDVLVRNPDHYVVGLRYRPDEHDAPTVTLIAQGALVRRALREGRRANVPEFADPPTARALSRLEVDDPVPEPLFDAVAVVFRWLRESETDDSRQ
jgi:type III secretion protein U